MFTRIRKIHMVGIGGSGMSGIAEILLNLGYSVSGSDLIDSKITRRLRRLGASVFRGHSAQHVRDADVVVFSNAIGSDNEELVAARNLGIPVIPRAEMLAELMRMKHGIAVAGTHGKTSTACMIASILKAANLDPTVIVGGIVSDFGSGGKLGTGDLLVAEACESDGTFLKLSPTIAVITSLEREHMDYYKTEDRLFETFVEFANKVPFYGSVIICLDQPNLQSLIPRIRRRVVSYGTTSQSDVMATDASFDQFSCRFTVWQRHKEGHKPLGTVSLESPGLFSVYNALASVAVALELGVEFEAIERGLARFKRAARRFEQKGLVNDILVIVDYAHHPTEIKETLSAAKNGWNRRILVAFQPHRYTRTKDLLTQFFTAFNQADLLVVTSIYPASEKPIPGVDGRLIAEGVKKMGHKAVWYLQDREEIAKLLVSNARPGDMILILGAGDIFTLADLVVEVLAQRFTRGGDDA